MHFHRDVLAICDTFSRHVLRPTRRRRLHRDAAVRLHLRARRGAAVPAARGGVDRAGGEGDAGRAGRDHPGVRGDDLLHRADGVQGHARGRGAAAVADAPRSRRASTCRRRPGRRSSTRPACAIIDGIGATEMLHIFISAAGDDIVPGSTGRAVPGYVATVLDASGAEAAPGVPGRLAVKGPTGCRYLSDPRQRDLRPGRLEHHRRHVLPRRRRLLLLPGPQRRHDRLLRLQHRGAGGRGGAAAPSRGRASARSSACPTRRAGRWSRRSSCWPTAALGSDDQVRELQDFAKAEIAPYKYPRAIEFVDELPRTRPASCSASGCVPMTDAPPRQLILSLYGLYAREEGDWLSVASLIALMADLGVDSAAVRSSVSRLKRRGVLEASRRSGQAGYALSADSLELLREGDERIWHRPRATAADGWLVLVFSVPESERERRHELRTLLAGLGFGTAAPGRLGRARDVVRRRTPRAVARGADGVHRVLPRRLPRRRRRVRAAGGVVGPRRARPRSTRLLHAWRPAFRRRIQLPPADAFAAYVPMLTAWRRLPYLDPGLPLEHLPADWPGHRGGRDLRRARLQTSRGCAHSRACGGALVRSAGLRRT